MQRTRSCLQRVQATELRLGFKTRPDELEDAAPVAATEDMVVVYGQSAVITIPAQSLYRTGKT
jgi:hypothetical protein